MLVSQEKYFGTLSAMITWTVLKCICVIPKESYPAAFGLCEKEESVCSLCPDRCSSSTVWRGSISSPAAISCLTSRVLAIRSVLGCLERVLFGQDKKAAKVSASLAERRGLMLTLCPKLIYYSFYTVR